MFSCTVVQAVRRMPLKQGIVGWGPGNTILTASLLERFIVGSRTKNIKKLRMHTTFKSRCFISKFQKNTCNFSVIFACLWAYFDLDLTFFDFACSCTWIRNLVGSNICLCWQFRGGIPMWDSKYLWGREMYWRKYSINNRNLILASPHKIWSNALAVNIFRRKR